MESYFHCLNIKLHKRLIRILFTVKFNIERGGGALHTTSEVGSI